MTESDRDSSGELSSFLHLTGWRPLVLALLAGLAGAVGLFGALGAPSEWQARYVLNASRVANDGLQPAELDIFVEEIAQTAKFPAVVNAVEETTGLVFEEDYEITVNQSAASVATVDLNVVSEDAVGAQSVAIETGIEALTITLDKTLGKFAASAARVEADIDALDVRAAELTAEAGNLNPSVAYDLASQAVIDRRVLELNRETETILDEDGNEVVIILPLPEPPMEVLEAEVSRLAPIDREFRRISDDVDAFNGRLSDLRNSIRDTNAAISSLATERDQPLIISEVVTEETSRIAGLLSGLLLFAVPVALLTILLFTIWDFFRKKPEEAPLRRADDFEPAGILEAHGKPALPEASFTPLVVVDEDNNETDTDVLGTEEDVDPEVDDTPEEEPETKKRSKDGRWGRDASSKAG